ncbi:hypothetical protein VSS37_18465 [Candidatus Thiothrix sp. Deng01]|uniref:Uncharacterized protein n=1 Tax=Candidatus Thiothrix phosphatis TaxID=3112415 RepID=A0ABU6D1U2_9GAMM|nr:hypothetical protein [Candidatus Thiothrix sp. Deng01]MEB4592970.1 hypothetical protein [Candidatus Thiothrix sp. Deng01]
MSDMSDNAALYMLQAGDLINEAAGTAPVSTRDAPAPPELGAAGPSDKGTEVAPGDAAVIREEKPVAASNRVVLTSALEVYQQLVAQLEANRQAISDKRRELAEIRQDIRDLSTEVKREPRLEDDTSSHDLHTSKVAVQHDDCGSIIAYAEQVRRSVYDNVGQAEELLFPMAQSLALLRLRVSHIRLLEELLAAQESGLRLEIQQRNADACIWQLADILKV